MEAAIQGGGDAFEGASAYGKEKPQATQAAELADAVGGEGTNEVPPTQQDDTAPQSQPEDPDGTPRDPRTGQFVKKDVDEAPADDDGETAETKPPAAKEGDVDWQARYSELEKKLGNQGQELGEKVKALEAQLNQRPPEQAPALPVATSEDLEALSEMVDEGQGQDGFAWIVQNRPELERHYLKAWIASDETGEAQVFAAEYAAAKAQYHAEQNRQAEIEAGKVDTTGLQGSMNTAFAAVKADIADLDRLDLTKALEVAPPALNLREALKNPSHQEDAIRTLALIARGIGPAAKPAASAARAAGSQAAKDAAGLVVGSLRPAEGETGEMSEVEKLAKLQADILGAGSSSVASGLTYTK